MTNDVQVLLLCHSYFITTVNRKNEHNMAKKHNSLKQQIKNEHAAKNYYAQKGTTVKQLSKMSITLFVG